MLREFFGQDTIEKKIEANEKKFEALLLKVAQADRETAEIFDQLEVTPEQVRAVLSDENNFTEEAWTEVQAQLTAMESKTASSRELAKVRKTYAERAGIQQQWLFVR